MRASIQSIMLLIFGLTFLVACNDADKGAETNTTPEISNIGSTPNNRIFNIEAVSLNPTGNSASAIFQILFEGDITDNSPITCSIINPNGASYQECIADDYITGIDRLTANFFDSGGEPVVLDIALTGSSPFAVNFDDNNYSYRHKGNASEVSTEIHVHTQRHHQGYNFSSVSVLNPNPYYQKAELIGAESTNIVLWDDSTGNDGSKLYQDIFASFIQSDTTDGIVQKTGAYIIYNTDNGEATNLFSSDSLQVVFSQHTDPAIADMTLGLNYNRTLDPASLFLNTNPPKRADIMIEGVNMASSTIDTPVEVSVANYTISWSDTTSDPDNTLWQLRLIAKNTSGSLSFRPINIRTLSMSAGDIDGPVLANGEWSWTVPNDFDINKIFQRRIFELYLYASNVDGSLTAQSESIYIAPLSGL